MNPRTDEFADKAAGPARAGWVQRGVAVLAGIDAGAPTFADDSRERSTGMAWGVLACAIATLAAVALRDYLAPANLVMLYLLAVVLVTIRFGRLPGILASFLAVLAFDVFLVPPYYSLTVVHTEYLFTFAIMLVVALLISHLTANLRQQAMIAHYRERRARALFELSRDLSGALSCDQIAGIGMRHLQAMFQARIAFFVPGKEGALRILPEGQVDRPLQADAVRRTAHAMFERQAGSGPESHHAIGGGAIYLPLHAPARVRGVLVVVPAAGAAQLHGEQERLLQTCASLIGMALERVHYADVAQAATVSIETERLRNSLLSAISHDIRTPLTAIVGLSSTMAGDRPLAPETRRELVDAIQENAVRMNSLVTNLLDMARLHAGTLRLNRQWQMLEEVVGSALAMLSQTLAGRRIDVALPPAMPLLEFDAVLMERVLCNLLDNAAKHAPDGGTIRIAAAVDGKEARIAVEDDGPGIPRGMEEQIFVKFARGTAESARPGVGLGLSICRTIVEAHGGRIWAENRPEGGARFVFTLPLGIPPADLEHDAGEPAGKGASP
ncbi:MAG TPA: ATP-binding protein [Noviherbaspirillum sp.]|nr:ATP-binding protein [Noviherbaspirillum sp.]